MNYPLHAENTENSLQFPKNQEESTLKEVITEKDSRDATDGSKFHLGREVRSIVTDFFSG